MTLIVLMMPATLMLLRMVTILGARWGRGWRFSTREGDSGDYWKVTKQRTPGELLARERKVAKTSLFQQLNRVSRKTEVFVFPVL